VIVDRLVVKRDDDTRRRLTDSLETATKVGKGLVTVATMGAAPDGPTTDETLSTSYACPDCGTSLTEITPRLFSFNSPFGACPTCSGLGTVQKVDPDRLIPDPSKSIREGAIVLYKQGSANWRLRQIEHLAKVMKFSLDVPYKKLGKDVQDVILHGSGAKEIKWKWKSEKGEYNCRRPSRASCLSSRASTRRSRAKRPRTELENYMSASALHLVQGPPAEARGAGGARGRTPDRHPHGRDAGGREARSSTVFKPSPREREIAGKDPEGDRGPASASSNDVGIGYLSLSRASANAVWRRGAAHPACDTDRQQADGVL